MDNQKNRLCSFKVSAHMTALSHAGKERGVLGFNEVWSSSLGMWLRGTEMSPPHGLIYNKHTPQPSGEKAHTITASTWGELRPAQHQLWALRCWITTSLKQLFGIVCNPVLGSVFTCTAYCSGFCSAARTRHISPLWVSRSVFSSSWHLCIDPNFRSWISASFLVF